MLPEQDQFLIWPGFL